MEDRTLVLDIRNVENWRCSIFETPEIGKSEIRFGFPVSFTLKLVKKFSFRQKFTCRPVFFEKNRCRPDSCRPFWPQKRAVVQFSCRPDIQPPCNFQCSGLMSISRFKFLVPVFRVENEFFLWCSG